MSEIKSILLLLLVASPSFCLAKSSYKHDYSFQDSLKVIEKVYLHTDRDYYSPGDDIWFKAYLTEAPYMMLSYHSRNLHVEFVSPESGVIYSRTVRLEGGLGNGDFRLSDSLQPGSYLIRAYTNYMRNFRDTQFFTKEIKVITSRDSSDLNPVSTAYLTNKTEIKFFPEGGSLINDITSVVGFKAVNALGSGCDVTGEVFATSGEMITLFRSTHKGMGKFYLRPVQGVKYYALVRNSDGETARYDLPESCQYGLVLNVSDPQDFEPQINIKANSATLPMLLDQDLSITISARKEIFKILTFKINSLFTSFRLPAENLPDGIIQLTLSGPGDLPLCERLIFRMNKNVNIDLITDKTVYKKRDSVSLKLNLSADSLLFDQAFLSLSAAEKIFLKDDLQSSTTISSWFLLESDIRGRVEDPACYFDPKNQSRHDDLDLLLCTQGWRDFEWKYKDPEYLPEYGFSISGRVERLFSRRPLKASSVTAVIISDGNEMAITSPVDSLGIFRFEEFDFTGNATVIVSAVDEKGKLKGNLILNSMRYIPEKVQTTDFGKKLIADKNLIAGENILKLEQDYGFRSAMKKKYALSDTIMLGEVEIFSQQKNEPWVNYQTQRIAVGIPDNIIEMTPQLENRVDIRDVLRSRVAGLTFEQISDPEISGIRIRGSRHEPVFMLDGIIVPYGIVQSIPLTWIDRIEILKSGGIATTMTSDAVNDDALKYNGVISVITKPPEERKDQEQPVFHSVNRTISGFDAPRIFYSPDHSAGSYSGDEPDLRSTIFWEPNITLENNGHLFLNFFNADKSATVQIIVEGITSTGIPVTAKADYVVE